MFWVAKEMVESSAGGLVWASLIGFMFFVGQAFGSKKLLFSGIFLVLSLVIGLGFLTWALADSQSTVLQINWAVANKFEAARVIFNYLAVIAGRSLATAGFTLLALRLAKV